MNKTITIFGSSLPKEGDAEFENAYLLGRLLAQAGFSVCTGGYRGIMHAVSKGAAENGGMAIGVTVDLWGSVPSEYLIEEVKCKTLFERIGKLVEIGDAYVVLRGGTGTLLELAVVWEFMNKNLLVKKPVICHSDMWKSITEIMEAQIRHEGRETGIVKHSDSIKEIADYIIESLS